MKKLIAILIAVSMLVLAALPAMAEEEADAVSAATQQ